MEDRAGKRMFTRFFVTYPLGYVIFLFMGVAAFIYIANTIRIPVYHTMETQTSDSQGGMVTIHTGDVVPTEGSPLYLYQSREDGIEKVVEYEMDPRSQTIVVSNSKFANRGNVNVDVHVGNISLLNYIFSRKEGLQ